MNILKAKNYEYEIYSDTYTHHENIPPVIKFSTNVLSFIPDQGSKKWINIIDAIENNIYYILDLSTDHSCFIQVNDGTTTFSSVHLKIEIPSYLCLDAFKMANQFTIEWLNKKL